MAARGLCEEVRRHCTAVAASARWVRVDPEATVPASGVAGLDPAVHLLDAPAEDVARYLLIMDAINFGSGWFPSLSPYGEPPTDAIARRLAAHARRRGGCWTAAELRALDARAVATLLEQDPDHELMPLYARALNQLGTWLGERGALDVVASAGGSADRFAAALARGMPFFADRGFYKRAQITANDLVLAGVASFADVDELTVFADNLVPHVLRTDGVLVYAPELAAAVDGGLLLPAGGEQEREIRACAVYACELLARRVGVPPRRLDNWLWNRGRRPPYSERPAHLTRTVFY
jgi:Potential Queuosine, Q, salvage protein family